MRYTQTLTSVAMGLLLAIGLAPAAIAQGETSDPAPEPVLSIPAELPRGVDGGTIETPAGPYRWIRIEGTDERPVPTRERWAVSGPLGLMVRTYDHEYVLTADGIDWKPWDPGVDSGDRSRSRGETLTRSGGHYWLFRGDGLWRSADGLEWQSLTPGGIDPPWPAGLDWRIGHESTQIVSLGETTAVSISADGNFPERELDLGACSERPVATGRDGVYRWMHDENCRVGGPVRRFEETENGLRVFDDASGEELTFIEGLTMEHIDSMTQSDELGLGAMLLIKGDEVTYLDLPWDYAYGLYALNNAFVAAPGDDLDRPVLRSEDGVEWSDLGRPDRPSKDPNFGVRYGGSVPIAGADTQVWASEDGVTWQEPPEGQPADTMAMLLDSGWFATEVSDFYGPTHSGLLWMHVGDQWVSLADLGTDCPDADDWRPLGAMAAGATTLVLGASCGDFLDNPGGTLWIIQPASPT